MVAKNTAEKKAGGLDFRLEKDLTALPQLIELANEAYEEIRCNYIGLASKKGKKIF